jgi:high affinity sulfate transporter 1
LAADRTVVDRWLPNFERLRRYQHALLRGDLLAGVTVAAYLIPQCMAYAELAGLPPVAGLWAVLAPMGIYAFVGSSPQLSIGPESTTAVMTAVALAPLAVGDSPRYAELAAALAIVVGALCILGFVLKLGFLADLLSRPILIGYMAGVALIMIAGQLEKATGVPVEGERFLDQIRDFFSNISDVHWPTVALTGSLLVFLFVVGHFFPRLPVPLLGVLLATAAVAIFDLTNEGILTVGEIPAGFPSPAIPDVSWHDLWLLLGPALGITVVGYSDNVLTGRSFASRHHDEVDANQELLALGAASLGTGFTQGFPISSSGSRTVIGDAVGGRTPLMSLAVVASVVLVLLFLRPLLAEFPTAALGALVIYAAIRLIDVAEFRRLIRFRKSEFTLALATTLGVLLVDILYGVLIAVALSVLDMFRRVARPHDAVLGSVPGLPGLHDVDDYPDATTVPGLVIYRYDAPLCFANAEDLRQRATLAADEAAELDGPVTWFVLNVEANVEVDITAVDALRELHDQLHQQGIAMGLARLKQDLRVELDRAGLIDEIGEGMIFPTLPTVLKAFDQRAEDASS